MNPQHSSESVEFYTPPDIVEAARATMGGIDFDPCTTSLVNDRIVKAAAYCVSDCGMNSGLTVPWRGRVLLNPPGGKCDGQGVCVSRREGQKGYFYANDRKCDKAVSSTKLWWGKLADAWTRGEIEQAIFIGFSLEVLQSTQSLPVPCTRFPICIPKSRIAFWQEQPDGTLGPAKSPTHANAIVCLPPDVDHGDFETEFRSFGSILFPEVRAERSAIATARDLASLATGYRF